MTGETTLEQLADNITEASEIMKTLSSRTRLKLMCLLMDGEKSAGQLAELLDMKLPAISQHLAKMRAKDLVKSRREGQTIYYSAQKGIAQNVVGTLCSHYRGDTLV